MKDNRRLENMYDEIQKRATMSSVAHRTEGMLMMRTCRLLDTVQVVITLYIHYLLLTSKQKFRH